MKNVGELRRSGILLMSRINAVQECDATKMTREQNPDNIK